VKGVLLAVCLAGCSPELLAELGATAEESMSNRPMRGFSWVVPFTLAAMPRPSARDADFLDAQGVDFIISLTEIRPAWLTDRDGLHLPIEDFHPPTLEQQQAFVETVRANQTAGRATAVHCTAGLGRSGTLLATWLVAEGMTADAAIDWVRRLRPGSIETAGQLAQIHAYAQSLAR
jgi:atypical dual specificity phosphatase